MNGDDGHRFFFFDGKNFTIFAQIANFYATVPAPSTIAELTFTIALVMVDISERTLKDFAPHHEAEPQFALAV